MKTNIMIIEIIDEWKKNMMWLIWCKINAK